MRSPALLLGVVLGVIAFQGHGLLAFALIVGYVAVDAGRYLLADA